MSDNIFLIYQLKEGHETLDLRFEPLDRIKAAGLTVERDKYSHVYTGTLEPGLTLETLYTKFNTNHPADFAGHSLSMSDIVVLHFDGKESAHYVDRFGFMEVPEFLDEAYKPHKYYSTQRPVDIGTYPKTDHAPVQIVNFDKREWVENATFKAWGYLVYNVPLTERQISDYELRAASDNPDHVKLAPKQLGAQTQYIGKWEDGHRVPDIRRLTWWYPDFGVFVKKDFVTEEQLAKRFGEIMESKARKAQAHNEKKPIAERLKEGAEQATQDNAAHPTPAKDTSKDR